MPWGILKKGRQTRYRAVGEGGSQETLRDSTCNLKQDQKPGEWVAPAHLPQPLGIYKHSWKTSSSHSKPRDPTSTAEGRDAAVRPQGKGIAGLQAGTEGGGSCTLWQVDEAGKGLPMKKGRVTGKQLLSRPEMAGPSALAHLHTNPPPSTAGTGALGGC